MRDISHLIGNKNVELCDTCKSIDISWKRWYNPNEKDGHQLGEYSYEPIWCTQCSEEDWDYLGSEHSTSVDEVRIHMLQRLKDDPLAQWVVLAAWKGRRKRYIDYRIALCVSPKP